MKGMNKMAKPKGITNKDLQEVNRYLKTLNISTFANKSELYNKVLGSGLFDRGEQTINEYKAMIKLKAEEVKYFEQTINDISKAIKQFESNQTKIKQNNAIIESVKNTPNITNEVLKRGKRAEEVNKALQNTATLLFHKINSLNFVANQQAAIISSEDNKKPAGIVSPVQTVKNIDTFLNLTTKSDLAQVEMLQAIDKVVNTKSVAGKNKEFERFESDYPAIANQNFSDTFINSQINIIKSKFNVYNQLKTKTQYETKQIDVNGQQLPYKVNKKDELLNIIMSYQGRGIEKFAAKYSSGAKYTDKFLVMLMATSLPSAYTFTVHYATKTPGGSFKYDKDDDVVYSISLKIGDIIQDGLSNKQIYDGIQMLLTDQHWNYYDSSEKISQIKEHMAGSTSTKFKAIMKPELRNIFTKKDYKYNTFSSTYKKDVDTVDTLLALGAKPIM